MIKLLLKLQLTLSINEREGKELEVSSEIPIFITQGYSRDHRPDLKQCVLDLIVSSELGEIGRAHV